MALFTRIVILGVSACWSIQAHLVPNSLFFEDLFLQLCLNSLSTFDKAAEGGVGQWKEHRYGPSVVEQTKKQVGEQI